MTAATPTIALPTDMLPSDGRFGSGPTRIRPEQVEALRALSVTVLGTSHRQSAVRSVVGSVRAGIASLLGAPEGYEVVLGNGGSTALWDALSFCVVRQRAQCATFGEFGGKFAAALERAPFLGPVDVRSADPGSLARPGTAEGIDVYAHPHNETSTGVLSPVQRIAGASGSDGAQGHDAAQGGAAQGGVDAQGSAVQGTEDALTVVDATSAAGGVAVDLSQTDVYYFAPQKALGSDGGLWLAVVSPAAIERIRQVTATRWVPEFLDLGVALDNSRKDQTLNTPAASTLVLLDAQLQWLNDNGGMDFAAGRTSASAAHLYSWAEASEYASPFVTEPSWRSPVVGTIDLAEQVDHLEVARHLRDNGIVDVEPYRKLGRNQLRIGMFPSVPTSDVEALTACIDHIVERL